LLQKVVAYKKSLEQEVLNKAKKFPPKES
jgi:hypothetical protein